MDRICSLVLLTLIFFVGTTESQTTPTFSTNIDLVVLNATVRDRKGWFVSDLTSTNFEVFEDRVPQAIRFLRHEDIPVTVGLVVDHSSSMAPKLAEVVAAARTFVEASRSDDDMFVVNFNESVTLEPSDRPDQLARAITSRPAAGETALYDAVIKSLAQLPVSGPEKKVLIIISDGGDNASHHVLADVLKALEQSNALVYTIGVFDENDLDGKPFVLRHLAHVTGGEAFFPRQLEDVVSICERIAHDIRNQYIVGYVSSNAAQPGVFHSIRLEVRAPGKGRLVARTRAGYITGETAK